MTASVLQFAANDPATSAATTAQAFGSNTTAGSTILVYTWGNFVDITGVTDTQSNTYSLLDTVSAGQLMKVFYAINTAGGANTVTATWASSTGVRPILIVECGGVAASPLDGHVGNYQVTPVSTSTDAVTSTAATSATQPALVVGASTTLFNTAPTAGSTGWTDHGAFWNTSAGGIRLESKRVTATGSQTALFTGVNTADKFSHVTVLDESSATGFGPLLADKRNRLVL